MKGLAGSFSLGLLYLLQANSAADGAVIIPARAGLRREIIIPVIHAPRRVVGTYFTQFYTCFFYTKYGKNCPSKFWIVQGKRKYLRSGFCSDSVHLHFTLCGKFLKSLGVL